MKSNEEMVAELTDLMGAIEKRLMESGVRTRWDGPVDEYVLLSWRKLDGAWGLFIRSGTDYIPWRHASVPMRCAAVKAMPAFYGALVARDAAEKDEIADAISNCRHFLGFTEP